MYYALVIEMRHNLAWFDVGGSFLATPTVSMHFGGPIFQIGVIF